MVGKVRSGLLGEEEWSPQETVEKVQESEE